MTYVYLVYFYDALVRVYATREAAYDYVESLDYPDGRRVECREVLS